MRDAAVGFQCPSCVAEGSRTTRQARTAYGGKRSGNVGITSLVLIAANLGVWLAIAATGGQSSRLLDFLALTLRGRCEAARPGFLFPDATSAAVCGGTWVPGVADGAFWQLVTSMFTHVELLHLGGNMLALYLFGPQLEQALGRTRFLALYLVSGLAGSAMVVWFAGTQVQTLGASGAIFGLMGALLVLVHKIGGNLSQIGMLLLANVVITFAVPGISWQGHLGGFVGGVLVGAVLAYSPRGPRRAVWQAGGVGLVTLAVVVGIAVRLAVL
jgi:membrane associated rhomboid family serine protease